MVTGEHSFSTTYGINNYIFCSGEWFNGKTAAFKVADLGSNPCSPANMNLYSFVLDLTLLTSMDYIYISDLWYY